MKDLSNTVNLAIVIVIVGSLILLSFLLISNPLKVNKKANLFFGGFLLLWATFWSQEILTFIHLQTIVLVIEPFLKLLQLFIPILFYFGVLYFTKPFRKLTHKDGSHLLIPAIVVVAFMFKSELNAYIHWIRIFVLSILLQALFYTISSMILLRKHQNRLELFNSNRESVDLKWIKKIIVALLVISLFMVVYNSLVPTGNLNLWANLLTLIVIFYIAYHVIMQKEIFIITEEEMEQVLNNENKATHTKQKLIPNADVEELKNKLLSLMKNEKPYLEGDLTLGRLADQMSLSPHHLSYLLNEGFEENFFQFINSYRVEESKKLLLSRDHEHLSVMGIAYESGFNSKTAFNTVFKKQTGVTPTSYKKVVRFDKCELHFCPDL